MHLTRLGLVDFRSYAEVDVELAPGVSTFVGPNGRGKTNLIEAVGYLASLGSHRVSTDAPLVRFGAERAIVRGQVHRDGRSTLVELEITPGRANRARINGAPVSRPREVLGVLRSVLFAPEDLALVKGDPAERRRFLDDLLVSRSPRLAGVRADFERVLRQRNALLKSAGPAVRAGRGDVATLDVWDGQLARVGAELLAARLDLVAALRPLVETSYEALVRGVPATGPTGMDYRSSVTEGSEDAPGVLTGDRGDAPHLAELMLAGLLAARRRELERGVTLVGPHRDDLVLRLGPLPAKGYASHGEAWSFALALRLAAYDLLRTDAAPGGEPVLVLDDVFAELDTGRRERLAGLVAGAEQVLVTAAVPADVPPALAGSRIDVGAGTLSAVAAR